MYTFHVSHTLSHRSYITHTWYIHLSGGHTYSWVGWDEQEKFKGNVHEVILLFHNICAWKKEKCNLDAENLSAKCAHSKEKVQCMNILRHFNYFKGISWILMSFACKLMSLQELKLKLKLNCGMISRMNDLLISSSPVNMNYLKGRLGRQQNHWPFAVFLQRGEISHESDSLIISFSQENINFLKQE